MTTDNDFFDLENTVVVPAGTVVEEDSAPPDGDQGTAASQQGQGDQGQGDPPKDDQPKADDWAGSLTADQKRTIVEGWIAELPDEERLKIAPVSDLVNRARQSEAARTSTALERRTAEQERLLQKANAHDSLAARLRSKQISDDKIGEELDNYREIAELVAVEQSREAIWGALSARMAQMGITQIPNAVLERARGASTIQDAVAVYFDFMSGHAYNGGKLAGGTEKEASIKANYEVNKERIRQDHLAELKAAGLLRDEAPPTLSSRATSSGDEVALTDEKLADINNWTEEEHELYKPQVQALARELLNRR